MNNRNNKYKIIKINILVSTLIGLILFILIVLFMIIPKKSFLNNDINVEGTKEQGLGSERNEEVVEESEKATNSERDNSRKEGSEKENRVKQEVERILNTMTLEEKVSQLFMIMPEQLTNYTQVTQAKGVTKNALEEYPVGGLVYFSKNIQEPKQLSEMNQNIQEFSQDITNLPMFIGIDEEGGEIARIGNNSNFDLPKFSNMREIANTNDTNMARQVGQQIGQYLYEYGINLNFAPVADVITNPLNKVIGDRSFGTNPELVADMSVAYAKGLESQKVYSCMKHFPGHGDTREDSHEGLAYTMKTIEEIRKTELVPFKAGIEDNITFIMVSHISAPNIIGDNTPSSLSHTMITDILREEMAYDNIIITDAMNMGAITQNYSPEEAAILAIEAGVDIILMPENFVAAYEGVIGEINSGRITVDRVNRSVERILLAKLKLVY